MNTNLAYELEIPEEYINGEVVAMSPRPAWRHIATAGNIYAAFYDYLKKRHCAPIPDGMDLYLSEKDHFIPDMMVVCDREKIHDDAVYGAPTLVVEVLSPSTAKRDRGYKKDAYEAAGVKEYWIVDPNNRSIEVYLLEKDRYRLDGVYAIYPESALVKMTEEEKAAIPTSFRCSLFEDMEIALEDVFWQA